MAEHTTEAPRGFTGRFVHRFLVIAFLLGVLLPILTTVSKLAANDFHQWKKTVRDKEALASAVRRFPVLDLEKTAPILARLAWTNDTDDGELKVYPRYGLFNLAVAVVLVLFRRRIMPILDRFAAFANGADERRARKTIAWLALFIVFTYPTQAFSGVLFPGIGTWTYEGFQGQTTRALPPVDPKFRAVGPDEAPFLARAVRFENARYLSQSGYLNRRAMFLHFANGEVLPANYEILEFVFPDFIFGRSLRGVEHEEIFTEVLLAGLGEREKGRRFLLPLSVAYPNHSVFMPIDYRGYPPPETLTRFSFWLISLEVHPGGPAKVVRGVMEYSHDVR